jgi:hypothetical protein
MQPELPETKYEISPDELHAAISGGDFEERPWFHKAKKDDL